MTRRSHRGFTLLEVLVATSIMGIAVISLLAALNTSMRSAARLTEHDRLAMLARSKMDELLIDDNVPLQASFGGKFDPAMTGGTDAGYQVNTSVFEAQPGAGPGMPVLERIGLRVWWQSGASQRALNLEAFRRNTIPRSEQQ